jgi:hypothetical protein
MTPEQQAALRAAFPKSAIGKLPKGGAQLDYVGHAAVTDRLLAVDPSWSWEPVAFDEGGLPRYDVKGGLWIRLTVGGVTRLGYGDGPDPKQRIGDAIRNAAMRFGVALDLWSREEVSNTTRPVVDHEAGEIHGGPSLAAVALAVADDEKYGGEPRASEASTRRMFALFRAHPDLADREARLGFCSDVIGRPVTSSGDLTQSQVNRISDALERRGGAS